MQIGDATPLGGGQTTQYSMAASTTSLALIATAAADDLLAVIGIEIYDAFGYLVSSSAPTPGFAVATVALPAPGNYIVRVHNFGALPVMHTPTLIVREPWTP
jgi:hypothetical protein